MCSYNVYLFLTFLTGQDQGFPFNMLNRNVNCVQCPDGQFKENP